MIRRKTDVLIMTKKLYKTQAKQMCLKGTTNDMTLTKNRCTQRVKQMISNRHKTYAIMTKKGYETKLKLTYSHKKYICFLSLVWKTMNMSIMHLDKTNVSFISYLRRRQEAYIEKRCIHRDNTRRITDVFIETNKWQET